MEWVYPILRQTLVWISLSTENVGPNIRSYGWPSMHQDVSASRVLKHNQDPQGGLLPSGKLT